MTNIFICVLDVAFHYINLSTCKMHYVLHVFSTEFFILNLPTTWNCKRVMSDLMWILTVETTQATNGNEFFNLCNRLSMTTALISIKYEYLRWVLTFVLNSIFWLEINNIISMVFKTGEKMKGLHKNFQWRLHWSHVP